MKTEVIPVEKPFAEGVIRAGKAIEAGQLVAFPTETVYGLGANGLDGKAVEQIFLAKGRPQDNPLILHVAEPEAALALWDNPPQSAKRLMETFWPGPLTIIYKKAAHIPDQVTAGLDSVAVRLPAHPVAREMIRAAGVPVAAPSANLSGKPSPTTAAHVLADMDGRIPMILDGGSAEYGVESTVVSLLGEEPVILRPGAVTKEMLEAVLGGVQMADSILSPMAEGAVAASPGMKYKHYAPNARVRVFCGRPEKVSKEVQKQYNSAQKNGTNCKILATEQTKDYYSTNGIFLLGDREQPVTLCKNLFAALRDLGDEADLILAEGIPPVGEGLAYMNRLLRAAGFDVVYLQD